MRTVGVLMNNHDGGRGVKLKGKLLGSMNNFFHHMSLSSMHVLRHNLLGGLLSLREVLLVTSHARYGKVFKFPKMFKAHPMLLTYGI